MSDLEPITREEAILAGEQLTPITRKEKIISGEDLEPITREEWFLKKYYGGGGGDVTIEPLTATDNGTYSETGKAYSPVTVAVPLGTKSITANGTYDATDDSLKGYSSVNVDVPLPDNAYLKKDLPTGAIATVTDAEAEVMPSLKIAITPVQSGSGDPSPTNIRPISGWTGAEVNVCGKNLLYGTPVSGAEYYTDTGAINTYSNIKVYPNVFVKAGTYTWACSASSTAGQYMRINELNLDGTWVRRIITEQVSGGKSRQITFEKDCLLQFAPEASVINCKLEVGSIATSYETAIKQTYSIPFTDGTDPITVYDGELDVETGILTVYSIKRMLGASTYEYSGSMFVSGQIDNMLRPVNNFSIPAYLECNAYKVTTASSTESVSNDEIIGVSMYSNICIRDSNYTDPILFKQHLTDIGAYIVHGLATPATYQLSPTAIKTLLNTNNIFADTGDILDGEYWSKNPITVTRAMLNTLRDAGEITPTEEPEEI